MRYVTPVNGVTQFQPPEKLEIMNKNDEIQPNLAPEVAILRQRVAELELQAANYGDSWAQIEQAKQEWEATADALPELICLLDEQQRVVRANRTIETWGLGAVVHLKGKLAHQLLHPDCEGELCPLLTWLEQGWQQILLGQSAELEFYDGYLDRYLHGQMRRVALKTQSHHGSFAVLVVRDISHQKQLDKELSQYRNHLEQLVQNRTRQLEVIALLSERLNIIIDFDQLLVELVHQIKDNFGYYQVQVYILDDAHDQLIMKAGQSDDSAWLPQHTISLGDENSLVAQSARMGEVMLVNNGPSAAGVQFSCEMTVPIIAVSEVLGVLNVCEIKLASFDENDANLLRSLAGQVAISLENAKLYEGMNALYVELRESEAKFREVVEGTDNLITQVNREGYFTYVNHMAKKIYGLSPTACFGLKAIDFTHPDDRERTEQAFTAWEQQHAFTATFENRQVNRISGEVFHLFWNITFHYDKKGQLTGRNSITHDITERKQMEAAMQKANEELSRLNADKDKFFSIVAHDLKGPFQPLLGHAELLMELAETLPPTEVIAMSAAIHRSGKQILSLLENLLQWSRLQMGRIEYEPKRIDLQHLAAETVNLLSETAKSKGIVLQSTVAHDTWIYGDENMLNTVIRNLTNNALKFTPSAGQVTISARQVATSVGGDSGGGIEVSVNDTGVGMSSEDKAKLFQTGVHHSTTGTANEKGTGLGLILCKEMVERNAGRIWVESELGQGTTVKFTVQRNNQVRG